MIITTTPTIEGCPITQYHGIVVGEVICGINFIKDFKAGLTNFFGGRSTSYENELIEAREAALAEMKSRASRMRANAVVGIDFDYEVLGAQNNMIMVTVSGTAVTVQLSEKEIISSKKDGFPSGKPS